MKAVSLSKEDVFKVSTNRNVDCLIQFAEKSRSGQMPF